VDGASVCHADGISITATFSNFGRTRFTGTINSRRRPELVRSSPSFSKIPNAARIVFRPT
jgi:hypothetical protein